jgi:tetratricopeptide (TPR) repeat protein
VAIELFQRAREAYQQGRYSDAARDLEQALALDPSSPTLLFNLARVSELSGELDRAIEVYQRYLEVLPPGDAAERDRTEAAIRRMQGAQEYRRSDEDVYSQPIYVSQRGVADDAFWGTLGAGAAITLGGVALMITTVAIRESATQFVVGLDGNFDDRAARFALANDLALATDITGAVGGAALLAAGLLWVARERTVEMYPGGAPPIATIAPTPGGFVLHVGGEL